MDTVYSVIRIDCDDKGRTIAFGTESVYASPDLAWEHMRRRHYALLMEYGLDCVSIAKRYGGDYDIRLSVGGVETAWIVQKDAVHHSFITVEIKGP